MLRVQLLRHITRYSIDSYKLFDFYGPVESFWLKTNIGIEQMLVSVGSRFSALSLVSWHERVMWQRSENRWCLRRYARA